MKIKVGDILIVGKNKEKIKIKEIFQKEGKTIFRTVCKLGYLPFFMGYIFDYNEDFLKYSLAQVDKEDFRKQLKEIEI